MKIIPSIFAREVRVEYRVERHPTPKRRRGWRVVKHLIDRPGIVQAGDTFYVHPDLMPSLTLNPLTRLN